MLLRKVYQTIVMIKGSKIEFLVGNFYKSGAIEEFSQKKLFQKIQMNQCVL